MMNYQLLSQQVLRALRGRRSQVAHSRKLGYRTNVAYAWESGRASPTAASWMRAMHRCRLDPAARIARFFNAPPPWLAEIDVQTPEGIARLLTELRGQIPVVEVAKSADRNRYAVARWLSGATQPRLPDFFRLVAAMSLRLLDFIALFVDPAELPEAAAEWRRLEKLRKAFAELPWMPAVLLAIELSDYTRLRAHEPGWIARRLGISEDDEARCLKALGDSGQIRRRGRRWVPAPEFTVDTRRDLAAERRMKSWWTEVGLRRLREGKDGLYSFNVFTISRQDFMRLQELHRAYFRNLRAIVARSSPAELVAVANVHLFALEEL